MSAMSTCSRREFNVALLAGAGCALFGCTGGAPDGTVTPIMNQVTLPFARFPKLAAPGGSAVVDVTGGFPILVARTAPTVATALSATCTHAGCLVSLPEGASVVHCPCHDANFALDGSVLGGPTSIPLPVYRATVGPDAITVDLS